MRKNTKGYTLSEVLITISIIGAVAALILPHLVSTRTSTIEPSINRTANLLENGMTEVITEAQNNNQASGAITTLDTIRESDIFRDGPNVFLVRTNHFDLFDRCNVFLGIERISDNDEDDYLESVRDADDNVIDGINNSQVYKPKKLNTYITIRPFNLIGAGGVQNDAVLTTIYIDGNGSHGPNRLKAREDDDNDIIIYDLRNNGQVTRQQ